MPEESTNKPNPLPERVGKYEVLSHIASGGMGIVYKARDVDLDRIVALKVLSEKFANDPKALTRFRREAKSSAQLRHDNIVAIYDVGEVDGTHFLALEYVDGTDLQNYIDRKCRLDPAEARYIIVQATRALVHAHAKGIVHRDIKPSNFLMAIKDKKLQVKLTDFGLAIRSENDAEFRVTRDGTTVGTVDYMSPEQAQDSKSVDIRSDIYSLGCTFYHMLAGNAPFARGTLTERLLDHMQTEPPDIRALNKGMSESLIAIVHQMLAKKPEDRYQTPAELLTALMNVEKQLPASNNVAQASAVKAEQKARRVDRTVVVENMTKAKEINEKAEEVVELELASEVAESKRVKTPRRKKKETPDDAEEKDVKSPRSRKETASTMEETDEEVVIPARIPKGTRDHKDDRDDDDPGEDDDESAKRSKKTPARKLPPLWVMATGGSIVALVLVMLLAVAFGRRPPRPKQDEEQPPPIPIAVKPPPIEPPPPPVPVIDTSAWKMDAGPLPWPIMDPFPADVSRTALRRQYVGPMLAFPDVPATAKTLRVRRLGTTGATTFRTVAEALAKSTPDGWTVIEIHDNGPISIPALTLQTKRSILLRGAPGYRPLLAWEPPKTGAKDSTAAVLLSLAEGKLALENLDMVMRWPNEQPVVVFHLRDADFHARDCTFSLVAKSSPGVTLVQQLAAAAKPARPAQVSMQRCYVRGADLTLLNADKMTSSLLVEESLIVGQNQPLIELRGTDEDAFSLHGIGSTFVTAKLMLRWRGSTGKGGAPQVNAFMLDSIMSRNDPAKTLGDMIHLADGAEPLRIVWKTANCAYAGWDKLLASKTSEIAGTDRASWRQQWGHTRGDVVLKEPWPGNLLSRLEERHADTFLPPEELAYAAWASTGSIGCTVGRLPAEPPLWVERAFDPPLPPNFPVGEPDIAPTINTANDGLYHGEQVDLNKIPDLGVYFSEKLKSVKPAPRVVLHLSGKGSNKTSSLRVKGIEHLILYFVKTKNPKDALKLEIHPENTQKFPLIEMAGGHLELIDVRLELSAGTFIPTMIQIQGGSLTLSGCWLQGPVSKLPDGFKSLVTVNNPAATPASVVMRNSVLLSNRLLLQVQDNVQLKARNCLFLSLGDGVTFEGTVPTGVPLVHLFDHTTWAIRQTTFSMRSTLDYQRSAPITFHAGSNAFINPFVDDADKSTFWRGIEALASGGMLTWKGRFNVYDARLNTYFTSIEKGPGPRQPLKDWQQVWAPMGEQGPMVFDPKLALKTIALETISPAALLSQLDRLVLPPQLSGDPEQPPPGVNLVGLGLLKKKG